MSIEIFLAKYPFLPHGFHYFKVFIRRAIKAARVLERAKERIIEGIEELFVATKLMNPVIELLSFYVAMLILRAIDDEALTVRYAVSEAERIMALLKEYPEDVAKRIFGTIVFTNHKVYVAKLHFTEYLKVTARYLSKYPSHKLTNQRLYQGYVELTRRKLMRLIAEKVKQRAVEYVRELPKTLTGEILARIIDEIKAVWSEYVGVQYKVQSLAMPPCMQKLNQ
ncbi:MAG: hypothetical protein DRN15_11275 [Thermoprotei archaeon]|nr:MAG: hypothetical protein DRN15_11275 [Thermoprotei archaeon]